MVTKVPEQPTLVLNRNWQPVHVATVERALVLLWNESARVVDPEDFQLYTWEDWSRLKLRDGEAFVQAVRFRLRVPEVVALTGYDRLPLRRSDLQPPQRVQAGPLHLPILRCATWKRGTDDRPRVAAVARWRVELGELRVGVHGLQQAEGRPHAGAGTDALRKQPVRPTWKPLYADHTMRIASWSKFISEAYWNVELQK